MATRSFCDCCGEPALPTAYQYLTLISHHDKRFYLDVNFSQKHYNQPRTTDDSADICKQCLIKGLDLLKAQVESIGVNQEEKV